MKKILLASTALVATAGIAAAEVSLSGSAEMGVVGGENIETQFHHDMDVSFNLSGESDNGIAFGAKIDLDELDCADDPGDIESNQGCHTVFISAGGVTLTMGDTDGAFDEAMWGVDVGGSLADDHTVHAGFNGNAGLDGTYDGQIARFDYAFSGFTGSFSAELDDSGNDDAVLGLGVAYDMDLAGLTLGVGLGYQEVEDNSIVGLSVDTTFNNGLTAVVNYSQADVDGVDADPTHMAVGFGYTMDALTIGVNYGEYDDWVLRSNPDSSGFGVAVNYDLGGGLEAQFGYGSSDVDGADTTDTYSLGLAMSF